MPKLTKAEKEIIELWWKEFEGEVTTTVSEMHAREIISAEEFNNFFRTNGINNKAEGDIYYFTLACFFLLYYNQDF